ncbi:hypothetical protein CANARDRAFT_26801 [[Candida] arabinofermentans NRRL YB-2248]|uniref:Uncharacterized protein n=1 Tax=[Candida] arabinofermentans NRRL YB-2248 TaxID=983967 RepID=A0A1E4T6R7_9ASCO|nr:hypothetical protein CANARDRAFT_26801 [[Candida] arabinofermentans NRRL YB-2248]
MNPDILEGKELRSPLDGFMEFKEDFFRSRSISHSESPSNSSSVRVETAKDSFSETSPSRSPTRNSTRRCSVGSYHSSTRHSSDAMGGIHYGFEDLTQPQTQYHSRVGSTSSTASSLMSSPILSNLSNPFDKLSKKIKKHSAASITSSLTRKTSMHRSDSSSTANTTSVGLGVSNSSQTALTTPHAIFNPVYSNNQQPSTSQHSQQQSQSHNHSILPLNTKLKSTSSSVTPISPTHQLSNSSLAKPRSHSVTLTHPITDISDDYFSKQHSRQKLLRLQGQPHHDVDSLYSLEDQNSYFDTNDLYDIHLRNRSSSIGSENILVNTYNSFSNLSIKEKDISTNTTGWFLRDGVMMEDDPAIDPQQQQQQQQQEFTNSHLEEVKESHEASSSPVPKTYETVDGNNDDSGVIIDDSNDSNQTLEDRNQVVVDLVAADVLGRLNI